MREKLPVFSYLVIIVVLFFYSFTQVDLGLAFSKSDALQKLLFCFQQIGYFNRPFSTILFVAIISLMFIYYLYFLKKTLEKKFNIKDVWKIIILTTVILAFSYNAFSYDLFNYIFYGKIVTFYHQNPYLLKALDFPGDPMLGFMHWTHNTYPYGPLWLGLTIPLSFIGSNIFTLTFFLFKFFIAGCYLSCVYLIHLINRKILPEHQNFNLALFALNPLVIIESLVSSHNDIVMILFALFGLYLFFNGKKLFSLFAIGASALIKSPTAPLLIPVALSLLPIKQKLSDQKFVWVIILFSTAGLFYVLTKLEIQPWYFLWVLPFICLLKPNKYVIGLSVGLSLGLLMRYIPFLYSGNWNGLAPQIKGVVTFLVPIIFLFFIFLSGKSKFLWKK